MNAENWKKEPAALTVFYLKNQEELAQCYLTATTRSILAFTKIQTFYFRGIISFDRILDFSHSRAVCVVGWSLPLGTLSTLGTRGTAGGLVVGVDAHPGLNHHHAVVTFVPAVFICEKRSRARC